MTQVEREYLKGWTWRARKLNQDKAEQAPDVARMLAWAGCNPDYAFQEPWHAGVADAVAASVGA